MEKFYNRRERKSFVRTLGLRSETTNLSKKLELLQRTTEAGKQINQQFLNDVETTLRNKAAEKDAIIESKLEATMGKEMARNILESNARLKEERELKLKARALKK